MKKQRVLCGIYKGFVMSNENIGIRLKALRSHLVLSLTNFGKSIGYSQTQIKRFEQGDYLPNDTTINMICETYKVDNRYFSGELQLEDAIVKPKTQAQINEETAARVKSAREERSLRLSELAKLSGIDY